jgi:hypothetical protein
VRNRKVQRLVTEVLRSKVNFWEVRGEFAGWEGDRGAIVMGSDRGSVENN